MKKLQTIILVLLSGMLFTQSPKISIEIQYNLYATDFDENEYLYKTNQINVDKSKKINQLISELENTKSINQLFADSKIDTTSIIQNPKKFIKYYDDKYIGWNAHQVDYISEKLGELDTYKKYFAEYLELGCCIDMHLRYRDEYIIKVFNNDSLIDSYTSRKSLPNTKKIPWTNSNGTLNYNISIDKIFFELTEDKKAFNNSISGGELTKYLVSEIIDYHQPTLYDLSAYDYLMELNELKTDFEVLNIGEVYGSGRYIRGGTKTYYARLTNNLMLSQLNIMFLAMKKRKSIYSRDSIKSDYKTIIDRVQNVEFLINYIKQNPSVKIDIYYFNNKPINDSNIDGFNKSPEQWAKHDNFLENIKQFEKDEPKPSYANEDAIRVSKQLYCGCNFRFEKEFADKAVFIELKNTENKENSIWYLLPDNTVLLYIMQGEKVLEYNYSDFGKSSGLQYPCVLFDLEGNIIDRK